MKLQNAASEEAKVMTWDDTFCFRCHPQIDCFNTCCRDVTIFLTPLDAARIRKQLNMNSEDFLEKYTHRLISQKSGLPAITLKMREDDEKPCPFVTEQGCSIYDVRPYSCRMYPLDTDEGVEYKKLVDASTCHGLNDTHEWTVERWRQEQGLYDYDDVDHELKDVMQADLLWESKIRDERMQDMFLMSLYDLDRFREFIFKSSFLKKFHVENDVLEKIREDDIALLYFAGQWLRFVFFGKKGFLKIDKEYLDRKKQEVLARQRQKK
jgi:uncharacterized protein